MISKYKHKQTTWIDLENPTRDEIKKITKEYNLNPMVTEDLLTPSSRPTIEEHHDYLYLILHFPFMLKKADYGTYSQVQEIDFIIGKNFIITNRYSVFDSMLEFSKTFSITLCDVDPKKCTVYIFFKTIMGLYEEMDNRLAHVADLLGDIEEQIFENKEKEMVFELSKLNRLLLNFKKSISLQGGVLRNLIESGGKIYGQEYQIYFKNIYAEFLKIKSIISNHQKYLTELRKTNDSLLSTKQNETMKILTVVAFITFPLSIITNIFGMNTKSVPIIGSDYDFWIILAIMLSTSLLIAIFFKFKKWL